MTDLIGTDGNDFLTWEDGVTNVDGLEGSDRLTFDLDENTISPNYVLGDGTASNGFPDFDVTYTNIETLRFNVRDARFVEVDATQFSLDDLSAYTLSMFFGESNTSVLGSAFNDSAIFTGTNHTFDGGEGFDRVLLLSDGAVRSVVTTEGGTTVVERENGDGSTEIALRADNIERLSFNGVFSFVPIVIDASASNVRVSFSNGSNSDTLIGSRFDDSFNFTETQNDFANDFVTGGAGSDRFWFGIAIRSADGTIITDFRPDDIINFNTFGIATDEQVTTFIGTAQFTGTAGEYRYLTSGGRTIVQVDANGDGVQDANLEIANGEFVLEQVTLEEGNDHYLRIAGYVSGREEDEDFTGTDGADRFFASGGDDTIDGGSNVDTAGVSGNFADYTVTQTALGVFEVSGIDGTDTLTNVEFLEFDDQTIRLLPGNGVSVSFDAANPSSYQSAMDAIRDFDGNVLGGNGSWLFIGSADVNGDGDVDQLLVNRAIGRFATVGTAEDGLVYFDDHSWAGETRVAGIYIDPLVQEGIVEQFSPFDSQQRFQNDLFIENINEVLGSDDYDGDGLQEVYFALTDGTAYLRAIMEFDGNIRYANYQSEQEVRDYLTANGYGEETFGDWFGDSGTGNSGSGTVAIAPQDMVGAAAMISPMQSFDEWTSEAIG